MNNNTPTLLLTGGAGFLGSHLCDYFHNELKYNVLVIDNLITGRKKNIEHLLSSTRFDWLKEDICRIPVSRFDFAKIDYVLHFASLASPVAYMKNPIKTLRSGSWGTENALKIAKQHNAVFLLASTSEVYGDPLEHPQKESYYGNVNSVGPRACYDEGKRYAEALTMEYHRMFGVDTKIARIHNTYGPRLDPKDGRVVSNFIMQALTNKPLTIYGDGKQTRSLCYVDDMIDGLVKLLFSDEHYPVNLGNPDERTVYQIGLEICTILDKGMDIQFLPKLENDPVVRCPDITKARTVLNWEPKISLTEGLTKTIAYFRSEV